MSTKRKSKSPTDKDFLDEIISGTGGQSLKDAGRTSYYIDTGNLALNYICSGRFLSGGIPGGKITEVFGPPSTSKSLLAYCVLAGCQRMGGIGVYLDCERAGNADFAESAGHVDSKKLIAYEPISIQQVEAKILAATKAIRKHYDVDKPILFVWDSIGVTPTDREWKETELPENPTDAQRKAVGLERPGERARKCGDALRKLNPFLNEQNATLYVVNQIRQKIGVMFGSDEETAGGGKALPFYASCRLRTSAQKDIRDKEKDMPIGVNLTFRNKKNRSFHPGLFTKGVQLYFDSGINPLGGLLSMLIASGRIKPSGKGVYKVEEPWANGQEVKFKSNKERNDVPLEPLFKCPSIVDAESKEDLEEYMALFKNAVDLTNSDMIEEVNVDNDNESSSNISHLGLGEMVEDE